MRGVYCAVLRWPVHKLPPRFRDNSSFKMLLEPAPFRFMNLCMLDVSVCLPLCLPSNLNYRWIAHLSISYLSPLMLFLLYMIPCSERGDPRQTVNGRTRRIERKIADASITLTTEYFRRNMVLFYVNCFLNLRSVLSILCSQYEARVAKKSKVQTVRKCSYRSPQNEFQRSCVFTDPVGPVVSHVQQKQGEGGIAKGCWKECSTCRPRNICRVSRDEIKL